jgi:hypothetical protein
MNANEHLDRIIADLQKYKKSNKRLAVDEVANDFESVVNAHDQLAALVAEVTSSLKPLQAEERIARDGIAASLITFFGGKLKEGVNDYVLSNLRKLKFTYKVERKIEDSMLSVARAKFDAATDKVGTFDDLLRVKYELDVKSWKKLLSGGEAHKAVSEMLVAKPSAPTIEVD